MERIQKIEKIRVLSASLIVLVHCLCIYGSSWPTPVGVSYVYAYYLIGKLASCFALPLFFFISGYLFSMNEEKYLSTDIISFIKRKAMRLLLPGYIFSIFYIAIFYDKPLWYNFLSIFNGAGHLWFLPALFLCNVCMIVLRKCKTRVNVTLLLLCGTIACVAIFPPIPLFGLSGLANYFYLFVAGSILHKYEFVKNRIGGGTLLILATFVLLFVISVSYDSIFDIPEKVQTYVVDRGFTKVTFLFSSLLLFKIADMMPAFFTRKSALTMGIYIFQEFLIKIIYYYTPTPQHLGSYILPLVTFIVVLTTSAFATYCGQKTKIGSLLLK